MEEAIEPRVYTQAEIEQEFGNTFNQPSCDPNNRVAAHQDDEVMLLNPFRHLHHWYLVNPKSSSPTKRLALPKHWKFTGKTYKDAILYGWLKPSLSSSENGVKPVFCKIDQLGDVTFDRTRYFRGIWILRKEAYQPIYWLHEPDPMHVDGSLSQYDLNWSNRQLTAVMSNLLDFCFTYEDLPCSTTYGNYTVTQLHDHLQGTGFDLELLDGCQTSVVKHLTGWCGLDPRCSAFLKSLLSLKLPRKKKVASSDLLARLEEAENRSQQYPWGQPFPGCETALSTRFCRRGLFDDSSTSDSNDTNTTVEHLSASTNRIQKKHDKQKFYLEKGHKNQTETSGSSILEEISEQCMPSGMMHTSILMKKKRPRSVMKDEAKTRDARYISKAFESQTFAASQKNHDKQRFWHERETRASSILEETTKQWMPSGVKHASISTKKHKHRSVTKDAATTKNASHLSTDSGSQIFAASQAALLSMHQQANIADMPIPRKRRNAEHSSEARDLIKNITPAHAASLGWGTGSIMPALERGAVKQPTAAPSVSWGCASTKLVSQTAAKKPSDQSLPASSGPWGTPSALPELQKSTNSSWGCASTNLVTQTAAKKPSDQLLPAALGSWGMPSTLPELQKSTNSSWGCASTKLVTQTAAKKPSDKLLPAALGSWGMPSTLPELQKSTNSSWGCASTKLVTQTAAKKPSDKLLPAALGSWGMPSTLPELQKSTNSSWGCASTNLVTQTAAKKPSDQSLPAGLGSWGMPSTLPESQKSTNSSWGCASTNLATQTAAKKPSDQLLPAALGSRGTRSTLLPESQKSTNSSWGSTSTKLVTQTAAKKPFVQSLPAASGSQRTASKSRVSEKTDTMESQS